MKREPRDGDEIVTAFRDGQVTLRANRRTEGFTNAIHEHGYQRILPGELAIHAMDAFAGAIGVSDSVGKSTPVYSICRPRSNEINPWYFALFLRHMALSGFISALAKGVRERSTEFRWREASEVRLTAPPRSEQDSIVAFLDQETNKIDALVAEQRRLIDLLREKRQAIISHAVTKGINPNASLKPSGIAWLGEIPEHWGVSQSRRMFAVRSEQAHATDQMLTASQKYGVIFQSDFVAIEGRKVVEVILGKDHLRHVEPDDFIISMRSFQGGIEWCRLRGSTSFHYVMLRPVKDVYPPFFAHVFKSITYIQALRSTTDLIRDGQELRFSHFVQVPLPVVPLSEQKEIAEFLTKENEKVDALVSEAQKSIELLQERRQALIAAAVTGQIEVRDLVTA